MTQQILQKNRVQKQVKLQKNNQSLQKYNQTLQKKNQYIQKKNQNLQKKDHKSNAKAQRKKLHLAFVKQNKYASQQNKMKNNLILPMVKKAKNRIKARKKEGVRDTNASHKAISTTTWTAPSPSKKKEASKKPLVIPPLHHVSIYGKFLKKRI